jgi:hypothetical protein
MWLPLADIHKYHPVSWSRKQVFLPKLLDVSTHHHTSSILTYTEGSEIIVAFPAESRL